MSVPRPKTHLTAAGKLYPGAWKLLDAYRESRGREGLPEWPEWCFLPLAASYAAVSADAGLDRLTPQLAGDVGRLGALYAWRYSQGIYRFDEEVYRALVETPVDGDLPSDVLLRLPEWCVYIETPGLEWGDAPLYGFFAHLEWDANTGRMELRFLLDAEVALQPLPVHLGVGGIAEGLDEAARECRKHAVAMGLPAPGPLSEVRPALEPLFSLLLYLCSENAEIGEGDHGPRLPQPKRTKKGLRYFPPDKPTEWGVGLRLGAALRRARQQSEGRDERATEDRGHAPPRPHIRRAHWHTYCVGKDRSGRVLKWLPPIPVNLDDPNQLPATRRPVRSSWRSG